MKAEFTVLGEPVAKQRPRFNRYSGRAFTPEKTANYETLVRLEYGVQCPGIYFEEKMMLKMTVKAYFGISKSTPKKSRLAMEERKLRPVKRPDIDNIIKIVGDACNNVAYYDDSQIVSATVEKYYSERPRIEVVIEEI